MPEPAVLVFVSYSVDSEEHQDRVLELSDRLRQDGFEVILDQYVAPPPQNWVVWMNSSVEQSNFVLVIYTRSYSAKSKSREPTGSGWESILIEGALSFGPSADAKFIPVFFDKFDTAEWSLLPLSLRNASRYVLDRQYADLCSHLKGESRAERRHRETLQSRPPQSRAINFIRPWYVPLSRNPFDNGNDQLLREIHDSARDRRPVVIESGAAPLSGARDLVLEYTYRHKQDYSAVFWLAASTEPPSRAYIEIARMLNLEEAQSGGGKSARSGFIRWLGTNNDWLLVLDPTRPNDLSDFLPLVKHGAIVICSESRKKQWPTHFHIVSFADRRDEGADDTRTPVLPIQGV